MKKLLLIFVLFIMAISCSNFILVNEEGFQYISYNEFITPTNVCIQSKDGFIIDDKIYLEFIGEKPVAVINPLSHEISLKITDFTGMYRTTVSPLSFLEIEAVAP